MRKYRTTGADGKRAWKEFVKKFAPFTRKELNICDFWLDKCKTFAEEMLKQNSDHIKNETLKILKEYKITKK